MMKNIKQLFTHKAKNYIVLGAGFALVGGIGAARFVHETDRIERNAVGGCLLPAPTQLCTGYFGTYQLEPRKPAVTIGEPCTWAQFDVTLVNCPPSTPSYYWESPYSDVGYKTITNLRVSPTCPDDGATYASCEGNPLHWVDKGKNFGGGPAYCASQHYENTTDAATPEGEECGTGS